MSQKSFLDNKKSRKNFPYVGGVSTNIWKIPYVLSFLFLKASLNSTIIHFDNSTNYELKEILGLVLLRNTT